MAPHSGKAAQIPNEIAIPNTIYQAQFAFYVNLNTWYGLNIDQVCSRLYNISGRPCLQTVCILICLQRRSLCNGFGAI